MRKKKKKAVREEDGPSPSSGNHKTGGPDLFLIR